MPVVSVVTVFHRDSPFLRPAIASILAQTFRDFEHVLVDNGTGMTPEALGPMGADPRLRWVRLPRNEGIPAGHNAGIAAATGEFIALLDYDDLALPERLEKQVATLRADPGLGLVSALAEVIDEQAHATGRAFCIPDPAGHRAYAQYAAPVFTPVAMARREVFARTPYRPQFPFAADLDFQSRATEQWRMAVLPEVLLRYRWYGAQTTQQKQGSIDNSRCAISLITARRRAGRPEGMAEILCLAEWLTPAEYSRRIAMLSQAEGFWELAAYRARRALALEKTPASAMRAFRQGWQIWRQAPAAERNRVARMFLTGPVRALGLRPA
jgi:glycosyltransferase involved in cell wall biosynthesis